LRQANTSAAWREVARQLDPYAQTFGLVGVVHLVGWGLFALYAPRYPAIAGLGALAYGLGLRHAFDADHISAIDDTTRFLLQKGQPPSAFSSPSATPRLCC
jgi:high-affinity nickel permease